MLMILLRRHKSDLCSLPRVTYYIHLPNFITYLFDLEIIAFFSKLSHTQHFSLASGSHVEVKNVFDDC